MEILLASPGATCFLFLVPKLRSWWWYWLPVVVWMCLIFTASGDSGSFQHSSRLVSPFVHWLFPNVTPQALRTVVVVVRKGAHVTEYAILACLIWRAVGSLPRPEPQRWVWADAARTLVLVILYAASDEFHQRFVPTRDASVRDVLIDISGAVLALLLLRALHGRQSRRLSGSCAGGTADNSPMRQR